MLLNAHHIHDVSLDVTVRVRDASDQAINILQYEDVVVGAYTSSV